MSWDFNKVSWPSFTNPQAWFLKDTRISKWTRTWYILSAIWLCNGVQHSGHSSLHGSISLVDHDHMVLHVTLSCIKKWCATIERTANHTNVRRGGLRYVSVWKAKEKPWMTFWRVTKVWYLLLNMILLKIYWLHRGRSKRSRAIKSRKEQNHYPLWPPKRKLHSHSTWVWRTRPSSSVAVQQKHFISIAI